LEDDLFDLEALHLKLLEELLPLRRLAIVKCRQAVHEPDSRIARRLHQSRRDAVLLEELDPFGPLLGRLPHRDPDVGVDEVAALYALLRVLGQSDARAGFLREGAGAGDHTLRRPELLRGGQAYVHAHPGADQEQRVAHVVARVAEVAVRDPVARLFGAVLPPSAGPA